MKLFIFFLAQAPAEQDPMIHRSTQIGCLESVEEWFIWKLPRLFSTPEMVAKLRYDLSYSVKSSDVRDNRPRSRFIFRCVLKDPENWPMNLFPPEEYEYLMNCPEGEEHVAMNSRIGLCSDDQAFADLALDLDDDNHNYGEAGVAAGTLLPRPNYRITFSLLPFMES